MYALDLKIELSPLVSAIAYPSLDGSFSHCETANFAIFAQFLMESKLYETLKWLLSTNRNWQNV